MLRKSIFAAAIMVVANGGSAWAQTTYGSGGPLGVALDSFFSRLDLTLGNIPGVVTYLNGLPALFDFRITALLVGIVIAGLAAEQFARMVLQRARLRVFERHAGESPLRAFLHAVSFDALALLALWLAARLVVREIGDGSALHARVAHEILVALVYWRGFNLVFRAWLRPNTPEGRIAPVDDDTAQRLLVGLNFVIVLPMIGRHLMMFLISTGASKDVASTSVVLYVPFIAAGLLYVVWHWRHDHKNSPVGTEYGVFKSSGHLGQKPAQSDPSR